MAWPGSFLPGCADLEVLIPVHQGALRMQDLVQVRHPSPPVRPPKVPPGLQGSHLGSHQHHPWPWQCSLNPGQQKEQSLLCSPSSKQQHPPRTEMGTSTCPTALSCLLSATLLLAPAPWLFSFPKSRSGMLWPVFMAIMNMVKINTCIFNVSINKGKQSLLLT